VCCANNLKLCHWNLLEGINPTIGYARRNIPLWGSGCHAATAALLLAHHHTCAAPEILLVG
jgi:hypothetical protein